MKNQDFECAVMTGIEVVNARHDGYRRAGFALKSGKNELPPVDIETLEQLKSDPFLVVTIIGEPYEVTEVAPEPRDEEAIVYTPTQDELLSGAVIASCFEATDVYFNQDGSPKITKWRDIVEDKTLTKEQVITALDAAKSEV